MHISYMKSVGIETDNKSLLLVLEKLFKQTNYISKHNTYYYMGYDFTDVPSEDRNVWINNNDWFRKSTISTEAIEIIIGNFNETDGINEEPVRDFLLLLKEVDLKSLEIKIFEID